MKNKEKLFLSTLLSYKFWIGFVAEAKKHKDELKKKTKVDRLSLGVQNLEVRNNLMEKRARKRIKEKRKEERKIKKTKQSRN